LQINEYIILFRPARAGKPAHTFDADAVLADKGVPPKLIVDWLALAGDAGDNIPGCPGVGEKRAPAILERFGSLDAVFAALASEPAQTALVIGKTIAANMQAQRAGILQARQLVALRTDAPVDADDLLKKRAPRLAEVPPPLPEETERMPDDTKEKHAEWRQVPEPEEPEPETTAEREQQSGPVVIDAQGEPVDVDPIEVQLTDDGTPDVRVAGAPRRTSGALALTESPELTLALEPKGMNHAVWLAE
jgi:hypothetical protein